ncbi:hypothetical protein B0T14DRAFT_499758 [Immersiella caudata]|uniref:Uncharacterized protein n=1 Tax=Immersiella caudata TaxID=314043 RepID=A0AA39WFN3_9PEZI|nr:hypothetical protein B0T14DRAFT_499758 [Immersiella caudata]
MLFFPFLLGLAAATPTLLPLSDSCTPASFTNITHFTLLTYKIETVTSARENGIQGPTQTLATFAVKNPGSGDTYVLNRIPISTGGGVWSTCIAGETPLPGELKRLLLFDATIIGSMPTEVCAPVTGADGVTQLCELDAKEVELPVANIYWEDAQSWAG